MLKQPLYIVNAATTFRFPPVADPACSFEEPDYKAWIPNAALRRRMSRLVRMGVATGLQCLREKETSPGAILTATGLGCLADTEKFMNAILDNGEQLLAPTAFIQSTFNTVGAQIALLTGNHCYNNTYVHRGFSFESALLDAALLIAEEEAATVLAGAMDEMTPVLHTILGRMGCWRRQRPGEGAAFFLLSGTPAAESRIALKDMELFGGSYTEEDVRNRLHLFLEQNKESDARILHPEEYKQWCGEYPTSISFALWYAYRQIAETNDDRAWAIRNHYAGTHSFLLLKRI